MVVTCEIQFENNPEGCYFGGQVMTGKIVLSADKVKQVKAVVLKIRGFAHTSWSEKTNDKTTHYSGHIDYINSVTYLLSPKSSDESLFIEPGIHSFNFACHIPLNCPSSFEGLRGHIRYIVQVNMERPWKFDQTFSRGFTVLKILNLNYDTPLLKLPANSEMTKVFCCGPMKSDPLQMHVQLSQTGYVPGQLIPVTILVHNNTKVQITEVCLRLVMMVCVYSQNPRCKATSENRTISKLIGDPVPVLCNKQFTYLLPVPATPPTCFNLCSIVQVGYRIEVAAKMKGVFYTNQEIHVPVTIGNVPLMDVVQQQPMATRANMLSAPEEEVAVLETNNLPWSDNENIPCPTFEASGFMPQAEIADPNQHDYGETNFSPKYPVFNIPSPTIEEITSNKNADANKSTWL
ncbi:arrestin domain-containing protein 17 [Stomoxys calcitrans]|uniref:Arrestin C-terminal-like domain-containing protein n=1 Tax=Stomoxys calcitrans TaxID=35570 RepID=A0A1I8Q5N2_STOCA|nr:arrestin domain-containing protein 17 [Stomoxys calcitrans]